MNACDRVVFRVIKGRWPNPADRLKFKQKRRALLFLEKARKQGYDVKFPKTEAN